MTASRREQKGPVRGPVLSAPFAQRQGVKRPGRVSGGAGLLRLAYHTTPWESMALATLRKPATFAPTMRSPGLPTSTLAS